MPNALYTASRLRDSAGSAPDTPLDLQSLLPGLYPADCVLLPGLSVDSLRDWLRRHGAFQPLNLTLCRNRSLRGGIVAWRGCGLLFVDADDPPDEHRFTLAHEAAHYLQDHLYPRLDLLDRFGPSILPVLDGQRSPTREERLDALIARASLTFHTHLLERDASAVADWENREFEADAFACEILAPVAALRSHFTDITQDAAAVETIAAALRETWLLPAMPALTYARTFVAQEGEPVTLLHRLRLI
jgi:hypothetical protein